MTSNREGKRRKPKVKSKGDCSALGRQKAKVKSKGEILQLR